MQRRTAITTAGTISLVLLSGATAMAVNTGLLRSEGTGNVGKLAVVAEAVEATSTTIAAPPATAGTPRTIVITVPRQVSAPASGPASLGVTGPQGSTPTTAGSAAAPTTAARPAVSSTVASATSTTLDDDDHEEDGDEHDDDNSGPGGSTSTTRPRGGDDDD